MHEIKVSFSVEKAMTYTRWSDQFLQCSPLCIIWLLLAAVIDFRKCGSFPHLQNYCYILIQYEHVCWMLLDIIRKGAKEMKFTTVEALQGMHGFSWCSRECMTQQYIKMCTDYLYALLFLLAVREEELAFTFFLGQRS